MYKILIIEDDSTIANQIKNYLNSWDYNAYTISDFSRVLEEIKIIDPDLILMDITLPYKNGFYYTQELRKTSNVPILFLTSANDDLQMITAINYGADDYITKPCELTILATKIQALLRRSYQFNTSTDKLSFNGLSLNLENYILSYQGQTIELTKNECRILQALILNKNKIVQRDTLMEALWQNDSYVDENTLNVNVNRLRKKLERLGIKNWIETKKGSGYILC